MAYANDLYIAEGPGGGHYDLVISKTNLFVGLGAAYNGAGYNGNAVGSYFTETYLSSTGTAMP